MKKSLKFFTTSFPEFAPYAIAKGQEEDRVKKAILENISKRCKWVALQQKLERDPLSEKP